MGTAAVVDEGCFIFSVTKNLYKLTHVQFHTPINHDVCVSLNVSPILFIYTPIFVSVVGVILEL